MWKPVFRRLANGELKLDYTEPARRIKLSRHDVKKEGALAEKKSLFADEVGMNYDITSSLNWLLPLAKSQYLSKAMYKVNDMQV